MVCPYFRQLHHFLKDGLSLKLGFFSYMFKISVIFSVRSKTESCMLFICVVFVSILLTYCSLRSSVSSSYIVISACFNLSTSFLKSKSGSRIDEGCDALFFIAIFLNWGVSHH